MQVIVHNNFFPLHFSRARSFDEALGIYKKKTAAAPRMAPIPTEPVCMAWATPPVDMEEEAAAPPAGWVGSEARVLLAEGWPDVKGASEAELAPEKAMAPAVAEELAMVALLGLRTLRQ